MLQVQVSKNDGQYGVWQPDILLWGAGPTIDAAMDDFAEAYRELWGIVSSGKLGPDLERIYRIMGGEMETTFTGR